MEVKKIRSIIVGKNNKLLKLLKIKNSEELEDGSKKLEIFNRCLDTIGEDLNKMLLNKNYENTVLFEILALNNLCSGNIINNINEKTRKLL